MKRYWRTLSRNISAARESPYMMTVFRMREIIKFKWRRGYAEERRIRRGINPLRSFSEMYYSSLLFFGNTTVGLNFFASSKSILAYEITITTSPTIPLRAAGPLRQIVPDFLGPFITYVTSLSPLFTFTTCTCSPSIMLAASMRSSSMVMLPI